MYEQVWVTVKGLTGEELADYAIREFDCPEHAAIGETCSPLRGQSACTPRFTKGIERLRDVAVSAVKGELEKPSTSRSERAKGKSEPRDFNDDPWAQEAKERVTS